MSAESSDGSTEEPGSVSALLVQPLVLALASSSEALEAFFAATDLTPALVGDRDARLAPIQFCRAWSEAVRLSADPALGVTLAGVIPSGALGVVEYVCRASDTLGEALQLWVRYLNILNAAVSVGLVEEGDHVAVRVLVDAEPPAPASHELCFALLVLRARELTGGDVEVRGVDFVHRLAAGADAGRHEAWFGAPVAFGAEHTQLVLGRRAMTTKLVTADPNLLAVITRLAEDESAKTAAGAPPFTTQVRRALAAALRNNDGQVESVARKLGLTARSLQRRLKDEGSSFQAMREDVRRELAQRYLDDDLAITEISFLLGFSEPSAFFRAFKRWTGRTPVESRALRRAGAS